MAGEEASRVRLGPVEFSAGLQSLDDTDRDYLSKVAGILYDRPKVFVKLCAVSVIDDLVVFRTAKSEQAALDAGTSSSPDMLPQPDVAEIPGDSAPQELSEQETEYLNQLATKRASIVKDYLVLEFASDPSHLVSCQSTISLENPEDKSRVDLLI